MSHCFTRVLVVTVVWTLSLSHADSDEVGEPFFHKKYGWQAEKFFDDPKVIALCEAIEANDLEEIDRLVADGANVNALGKGNMTPLLWAYPENHPERFKRLLEHGADPNVVFESDFNTRMMGVRPGDSVTHKVCGCKFPGYFDDVFQHGGNPNLIHLEKLETPIFPLIRSIFMEGKKEKVERLIELGADLDANRDNEWTGHLTPVRAAKGCFGQYGLALLLLEKGADYKRRLRPDHCVRLIHSVEGEKRRLPGMSKQQREDYENLIDWLGARGESIQGAAADKERWRQWRKAGTFDKNMVKEIAARKAHEAEQLKGVARAPESFHKEHGWRAEEFFDDPKVIALCEAIEANDLEEIDRLVADGANVNALGKGNMTPLLWAYPENHPERFKRLLEHGADPNVVFESDFNTRMSIVRPGDSVTYMACACEFPGYFDHVFDYGGDPDFVQSKYGETLIYKLLTGNCADKKTKVQRLIELGAEVDPDPRDGTDCYIMPAKETAIAFAQYDIALTLFQAETEHNDAIDDNGLLIHLLATAERRFPLSLSEQQKKDYHRLVHWLETHGELIEAAKKWREWMKQGAHGSFQEFIAD